MINYLMKTFDYDEESAKKIAKSITQNNVDILSTRAKEYMDYLKINAKDFAKILLHHPTILNTTIESVKQKQLDYEKVYHISENEFIKMARKSPPIVKCTIKYVLIKEEMFKSRYGFAEGKFRSVILNEPKVVQLSVAKILNIEAQIRNIIGYSQQEFAKLVRSSSGVIFKYKLETLINRQKELETRFGINKKQFIAITTTQPNTLCGDAVFERIESLLKLGIALDSIIERAGVLGEPIENIDLKYKFAKLLGISDYSFLGGYYRTSLQKAYARACALSRRGKISASYVYGSENKLNIKAKLHSDDLINDFQLTPQIAKKIDEYYNNLKSNEFINFDLENSGIIK